MIEACSSVKVLPEEERASAPKHPTRCDHPSVAWTSESRGCRQSVPLKLCSVVNTPSQRDLEDGARLLAPPIQLALGRRRGSVPHQASGSRGLGEGITSRMEVSPARIMTRRSGPKAMPPWGGTASDGSEQKAESAPGCVVAESERGEDLRLTSRRGVTSQCEVSRRATRETACTSLR